MMAHNKAEDYKKIVAYYFVDNATLQDNMVIGIGSGSTIIPAVEKIAERVKNDGLKNIVFIPSSYQSSLLLQDNDLTVGTLDKYTEIDWTVDGADEVDRNTCNVIKGAGGCLAQEKILASASKQFYIIVDYTKINDRFTRSVPVEVLPIAQKVVARKLEKDLGGRFVLRMAKMKAGPVVTDNSNFILDWTIPEGIKNWNDVTNQIKLTPGVVEVGTFINMVTAVYSKGPKAGIEEIRPPTKR